MKPFFSQVKILLMEHLRMPSYLVATVRFPTLFFLIFAVPEAKNETSANILMASFLGFSIMGVMFLQFAHGLAEERGHAWYIYLRTLPLSRVSFFLSRMLVAGLVACLTAGVLTAVALATTPVSLTWDRWAALFCHLILGGLCFAVMGVALGLWVSDKVALPLGNMIYLPLSYAGGLWKPPELLAEPVRKVSEFLPSRAYGELLWGAVKGENFNVAHYTQLLFWMVIFFMIAMMGFRRQTVPSFGE